MRGLWGSLDRGEGRGGWEWDGRGRGGGWMEGGRMGGWGVDERVDRRVKGRGGEEVV